MTREGQPYTHHFLKLAFHGYQYMQQKSQIPQTVFFLLFHAKVAFTYPWPSQ